MAMPVTFVTLRAANVSLLNHMVSHHDNKALRRLVTAFRKRQQEYALEADGRMQRGGRSLPEGENASGPSEH